MDVRVPSSNSLSLTRQFIEKLQKFAKSKDITTLRLCEILDVQPNSFYRWRKGTVTMTLDTVSKLNERLQEEFGECVEVKLS